MSLVAEVAALDCSITSVYLDCHRGDDVGDLVHHHGDNDGDLVHHHGEDDGDLVKGNFDLMCSGIHAPSLQAHSPEAHFGWGT